MKYVGGKWRQGPIIAREVAKRFEEGMLYYEPFCGACGAAERVAPLIGASNMRLSDLNKAVITMWQRLQDGWVPSKRLSVKDFLATRANPDMDDPSTAFMLNGMAFMGRWGNAPASRDPEKWKQYLQQNINVTTRCAKVLARAKFRHQDYRKVDPDKRSIIYLDPPYEENPHKINRFARHLPAFDPINFWVYANNLVDAGHVVLVTEFKDPPRGWKLVHDWGNTLGVPANQTAIKRDVEVRERLYVNKRDF